MKGSSGFLASFLSAGFIGVVLGSELPLQIDTSFDKKEALESWQPRSGSEWSWKKTPEGGLYQLKKPGSPGKFRRPLSWSVWKGKPVACFEVEVTARCLTSLKVKGRDVLVIFGFQDPDHYYYVHFSAENSKVHNILAKVDGGERTPLPLKGKRHPRLVKDGFQQLKLTHDPATGEIEASVDGKVILRAVDRDLKGGYVGVGSFDDKVDFDRFVLRGEPIDGSEPSRAK
ncbi:MAG: hypothetical protein AAGI48_12015 [Verrucomicrobiota bacterium]